MENGRKGQGRNQDRRTLAVAAHPQSQHVGDGGRGTQVQGQWCCQTLTENKTDSGGGEGNWHGLRVRAAIPVPGGVRGKRIVSSKPA